MCTGKRSVVLLVGLLACEPPPDPPRDGFIVLGLKVAAPPEAGSRLDGLTAISARVNRVELIHRTVADEPATEGRVVTAIAPFDLTVDHLDEDIPRRVAVIPSPPGFVTQVRLLAEPASLSAVVNDVTQPVRLPSGEQTGLKIVPAEPEKEPFPVTEGEATEVLAVFDPNDRVVVNRGVGIILKPTIPATVVPPGTLTGILVDRFDVIFRESASRAEIDELNASQGTTVIQEFYFPNMFRLKIPLDRGIREVGEAYAGSELVENVSPVFPLPPPSRLPGDFVRPDQTFLNMPEAWQETTGSQAVIVAIVDDGAQLDHPDLIQNIWVNDGEIPQFVLDDVGDRNGDGTVTGLDLDVNADGVVTFLDLNDPSLIDLCPLENNPDRPECDALDLVGGGVSLIGWEDGIDNDGSRLPDDLVGWDFDDNDNVPDGGTHGTAVAGAIGAVGDNDPGGSNTPVNEFGGVAGNNWNVALRIVRRKGIMSGDAENATYYATSLQPSPHIVVLEYANIVARHREDVPFRFQCPEDVAVGDDFDPIVDKMHELFSLVAHRGFRDENEVPFLTVAPLANCDANTDSGEVFAYPGEMAVRFGSVINTTQIVFPGDPRSFAFPPTEVEIYPGVSFGAATTELGSPGVFGVLTLGGGVAVDFGPDRTAFPFLFGTSGASANLAGVAALTVASFPELMRDPCRLKNHVLRTASRPGQILGPRETSQRPEPPGEFIAENRVLDAAAAVTTDPADTPRCP